jgi:hypothetical protein
MNDRWPTHRYDQASIGGAREGGNFALEFAGLPHIHRDYLHP